MTTKKSNKRGRRPKRAVPRSNQRREVDSNEATIDSPVERTLREWGKIGLLVDDAPDADARIAAEVYGTDTLPKWWISCKTVAEGVVHAEALKKGIKEHGGRFVVVVDRYLPAEDSTERPQDWRAEAANPGSIYAKLYNALVDLCTLADDQLGRVILVTSFPRDAFQTVGDALPPFRARTSNPLDDALRDTELFQNCLGHFGPVRVQDAKAPLSQDKAKEWWQSVKKVKDALGEDNHLVVLVTGAGMSMWGRRGSAGIPSTDELVTYAAWWAVREMTRVDIPQPELHGDGRPCYRSRVTRNMGASFASALERFGRAAKSMPKESFGLPQILGHFWTNGFTHAPMAFNTMFGEWSDSALRSEDIELFRQAFEQGLRLATTLHDQGVTRQHRVAALLPFDLIITTNFDGLHERAALTVASSAAGDGEALKILARGIPWEPESSARKGRSGRGIPLEPESSARKGRSGVRGRLVRLYGSVWHGEPLAFESGTFEERQERVRLAVDELVADRGSPALTLVVVGHRLHEDYLPQTLREVCERSKWGSVSLVLVNPDLGWTEKTDDTTKSKLLGIFRGKNPKRKLFLARGRALDFFYDLRRLESRTH